MHGRPPERTPDGQIGANLKIYGAREHPSTGRSALSDVRTVGYGASQGDDTLHLLFLGQVSGVEQHRVGGLNGLGGVARVSLNELIGLLGDLIVQWPAAKPLGQPAPRALPRIGDEKDLQGGVREDGRPYVSPVDDDVVLRGRFADTVVHPHPDLGSTRHERNVLGDPATTELLFGGLAVQENRERGALWPECDPIALRDERRACPLLRRSRSSQHRRRQSPIQRSGVDVPKLESLRYPLRGGGLAGGGRPVDGDDGARRRAHDAVTADRSVQKPGYDTATHSLSSISISLPGNAPRMPNAIAMR